MLIFFSKYKHLDTCQYSNTEIWKVSLIKNHLHITNWQIIQWAVLRRSQSREASTHSLKLKSTLGFVKSRIRSFKSVLTGVSTEGNFITSLGPVDTFRCASVSYWLQVCLWIFLLILIVPFKLWNAMTPRFNIYLLWMMVACSEVLKYPDTNLSLENVIIDWIIAPPPPP